jgi:hypothetical protein
MANCDVTSSYGASARARAMPAESLTQTQSVCAHTIVPLLLVLRGSKTDSALVGAAPTSAVRPNTCGTRCGR